MSRALLILIFGVLSANGANFAAYDLHADAGPHALAAYQVKIWDKNGIAKILSVEGGEHPAFAQPPFFDPKAIQHNIIKLAAFSLQKSSELPNGRLRIATIHVELSEDSLPDFIATVESAAAPGGQKIKLQVTLSKRIQP